MFERRLKTLMAVLALIIFALVVRAAYVQIFCGRTWQDEAARTARRERLTETTRGSILDVLDRPIAQDIPCIDACVDYHVIVAEPDAKWVHDLAVKRVHALRAADRLGATQPDRREQVRAEERRISQQIAEMWHALATVSKLGDDRIDEIRQSIVQRVAQRRDSVGRHRQAQNAAKQSSIHSWFGRLLGSDSTADADKLAPVIADEDQSYPILRAIDEKVYNELGKNVERYPGLTLRPAIERKYPFGDAACHLIGRLANVTRADIDSANVGNALRDYEYNDLVGGAGLESLCEPLLRGTRGRVETQVDATADDSEARPGPHEARTEPIPGADVHSTIDMDLQKEIQQAFDHVLLREDPDQPELTSVPMHGAAVVIDIPTGEVRALVSVPGYDLNAYNENYDLMQSDELNLPLMNRATQALLEPGSTVKPMVGIGAITQGLFTIDSRIHCTGYLVIGGKKMPTGRCWTASMYASHPDAVIDGHKIPTQSPHPTGDLCFSDALERSCNVFFENFADRLGIDGLSRWYMTFGIGRSSGIGIAESLGRLPSRMPAGVPEWVVKDTTWFAGIGQGSVWATPLEMANVAATIARDGIWLRPRLIKDSDTAQLRQALKLASPESLDLNILADPESARAIAAMSWKDVPDRIDLHLSREALAAARLGMLRVVNSPGGTGRAPSLDSNTKGFPGGEFFDRLIVAGKTGTAQASPLRPYKRDPATGKLMLDDHGRPIHDTELTPSTFGHINPQAPWYFAFGVRADKSPVLNHSWFIGFAPADHPRIAFAVMVQYGGPGNVAAGSVARELLAACVKHDYVPLDAPDRVAAERLAVAGPAANVELLHDASADRPTDATVVPAPKLPATVVDPATRPVTASNDAGHDPG
jgi:penicillin-binding protein 2